MIKVYQFSAFLLFLANTAFCQAVNSYSDTLRKVQYYEPLVSTADVKSTDNDEASRRSFLKFEIPATINGSNIDPSPYSNFSFNLTDSKFSFKLGFPVRAASANWVKDIKTTFMVTGDLKANNGIASVYSADNFSYEGGGVIGLSRITKNRTWVYSGTAKTSSIAVEWWSIKALYNGGNYNLFKSDNPFNNVKESFRSDNYSLLITFNRFFLSAIKRYKIGNCIYSFSLGYTKTNNFDLLKSRTYELTSIAYSKDSTSAERVISTVAGKIGEYREYKGLSIAAEYYIPLNPFDDNLTIYFGNRYTRIEDASYGRLTNFQTGFFFRVKDTEVNKPDKANFSIVARFRNIEKRNEVDYYKDNFSVLIQAAIPLTFF